MAAHDNDDDPGRLLTGYRMIRHVAPPDAPFPGMLTRMPDGTSAVLVDAAVLGNDWRGWGASASGHLLTPLDIVRRVGGHDAALPVCTERVDALLARRAADGVTLAPGEIVTVAVSLLRGAAELVSEGQHAGEWWLTDAGRPVFAAHSGSMEAVTTSALLETLARQADSGLARILLDAANLTSEERIAARELDEVEERLFSVAAPLPVSTNILAPLRARGLVSAVRDVDQSADSTPARASRWFDLLAGHVDADVPELVSRTTTGVWRRLRSRSAGNRRPWIVAAGLAVAIVGVGLLWPAGEGGPATAGQEPALSPSATAAPESPQPPASPSPEPVGEVPEPSPSAVSPSSAPLGEAPEPPVDASAWVVAATDLLTARTECRADAACLQTVAEDATRQFPPGVIDLPPDERLTTLLDEFGGAAVLRVDAASAQPPSQLIVVVRVGDRILLRDVHDVAATPVPRG